MNDSSDNTNASLGREAASQARGMFSTAIHATDEFGSDLVHGASHLACELVGGVRDVGGTAVHALTDLLVDAVGGIRQVAGAALGRHEGQMRSQQEASPNAYQGRDNSYQGGRQAAPRTTEADAYQASQQERAVREPGPDENASGL